MKYKVTFRNKQYPAGAVNGHSPAPYAVENAGVSPLAFVFAAIGLLLGPIFVSFSHANAIDSQTTSGRATTASQNPSEHSSPTSTPSIAMFTKEKVSFKNNHISMAGELYFPKDYKSLGKLHAIVITHPAGAVKEQSPATYAKGLAESGFIVLTFDASHQGESGGEPRYLENPFERVDDIHWAIDYLTTLSFVDQNKIGALGICAGGGYTIAAATTDRRIRAIAGVSPSDAGSAIREGWDGKLPFSELNKMLGAVAAQRSAEAKGAAAQFMTYVPESPDENPSETFREAYYYYRTPRAQHPNSPNKVKSTSLDKLVAFSATDRIDMLLTQPLLLVVGSKSDARRFVDAFYDKAASNDKEVFVVEGATHVDLYDIPRYVEQATAKLVSFFRARL